MSEPGTSGLRYALHRWCAGVLWDNKPGLTLWLVKRFWH